MDQIDAENVQRIDSMAGAMGGGGTSKVNDLWFDSR
jgi:hypothetical protein